MGKIQAWIGEEMAPVELVEAHRQGLRHRAVSIFVMDGEKILLCRRAAPGQDAPWESTCCTHPEWGESAEACALRRLRDELGIEGLYPAHADRVDHRAELGDGLVEDELLDVYIAFARPGMRVTPDPETIRATRWVGLYDLAAEIRRHPERFAPRLRFYMQHHIDRILPALIR